MPGSLASVPPSDQRIYDAYIAGRQSAALAAAVRIGLFDLLDGAPLEAVEIARRLDLAERPVGLLAGVLRAMGLLALEGGAYALSADAKAFLVRGRPEWIGGLIDLEIESSLTPERVLAALRADAPSVYGGEDPWRVHARDPARARAFTAAMHSIVARPAEALAGIPELEGARRVLDVGGGSGAISIALARVRPTLRCTVLDLPEVCTLAREEIERAALDDRVTTQPGDMLREAFPPGHDVVVFSQILHDWPPQVGASLLAKAFDALPGGGRLVIHEKLVGQGGPLANALVDLDMLVWTEGQQWSAEGLQSLLQAAGFEEGHARTTIGYWSVVVALKPRAP